MNPIIRIKSDDMCKLQAHLFGGGPGALDERCAFAYAVEVPDEKEPILLVREVALIGPDGYASVGPDGFELHREVIVDAVLHARTTNTRLIEIHSHPHPACDESVGFSLADDRGQRDFARYLGWKHPGTWAALVFGRHCVAGRFWRNNEPAVRVTKVVVDGRPLVMGDVPPAPFDEIRYDRQVRGFGAEGQQKLARITVGIVGCGGLGSFIAMLAVLIGVRRFVLVDDDTIGDTNLNRLPHAFPKDVGTSKVVAMERYIKESAPDAVVEIIDGSLRSPEALSALRFCDVIAAGVDNDAARVVTSLLAAAYLIPYLDAASDIVPMGDFIIPGGRTYVWVPGVNCMRCEGLIDDDEVRDILGTAAEREARARLGYGGRQPLPSPSVAYVNAHVASSLIDELHALIAGVHPTRRHREYRANRGSEVEKSPLARSKYCACCTEGVGIGDAIDLTRFYADRRAA